MPMLQTLFPSLIVGLIAAVLFIAVLAMGLGFLFLFLPSLPLFWLGLSRPPKQALIAAGIAACIITLFADLSIGLFFLLLIGLPVFYIAQLAVRSRQQGGAIIWFPLGLIFTRLTFYAAGAITLIAFYYFMESASLEHSLAEQIRTAFGNVDAEYAQATEALANGLSFLIFSIGIWLWGIALYAHGWLINRQLVAKKKSIRPDFAITPFMPPNELLFLLTICAFATLVASPPLAFLGKILLVGFLLPYFFLGISLMHQATQKWPSRRFFLFFVYLMTLTAFWPAFILAGMGLIHHIKHLSVRPNSTRS
jgi:hypothetical protein